MRKCYFNKYGTPVDSEEGEEKGMVYLENIIRKDNLMYCDYYREVDYRSKDTIKPFKMVYDFIKDEIITTTGDLHSGYTYHAKQKLLELSKMEKVPSSAKEMWY